MSDPVRLLEDSNDLTESERQALAAGVSMRPPAPLEGQVWSELVARLPPLGSGGASSLGSGGGAMTLGASFVRITLLGAALGGGSVGAWAVTHDVRAPRNVAPIASIVAQPGMAVRSADRPSSMLTSAATHATAAFQPAPGGPPSAGMRPSALQRPASAPAASLPASTQPEQEVAVAQPGFRAEPSPTSEEIRLVATARSLLRSGSAARALSLLDEVGGRFPEGVLAQEREALAIEALLAMARHPTAEDRARAFARKWPDSPYAARVRTWGALP
jgi:hypothetical protein